MKRTHILFALLTVAVIAGCARVDEPNGPVACTADAKICPDGSAVGRDPDNNCEWKECPVVQEKPDEGLGLTDPYTQYVGESREQCAATDWICPTGSSQFFDDSGCGCKADEPKKYVSEDPEQCKLVKFMCEENRVPFFDETGCGCEYSFPEEAPSMPPAPGKLQAIDCTEPRPEACTMEYMPVCGWFSQDIQCVKYPCAADYGNKCAACADAKVAYYTDGVCPSGDDGVLR